MWNTKEMITIAATSLVLASLAAAQPAHTLRVQQATPEAFAYGSENGAEGSHSYLGIDPKDITAERVGPLKLREESGVEILTVDKDAPAGKAGLQEHDVILTVNGSKLEGQEQLRRIIKETPPGRSLALGISRDGQPMNITAQLADRNKVRAFVVHDPGPPLPPNPPHFFDWDLNHGSILSSSISSSLGVGMVIEGLTPQLSEYFGAKEGEGVLVRTVVKGTPAQNAGLRAGDVIVRVEKETVRDARDVTRKLSVKRGANAAIVVLRGKHEITLSIAVPNQNTGQTLHQRDAEAAALNELSPEPTEMHMDGANDVIASLEGHADDWKKQIEVQKLEMEKVRPEIEKALREAMKSQKAGWEQQFKLQSSELQKIGPEVEKAMKNLGSQKGEMEKQMLDLRKQLQELKPLENLQLQMLGPDDYI